MPILRYPAGAYLDERIQFSLRFQGPRDQVHARIYGAGYYLVITPSKEPKLAKEIRTSTCTLAGPAGR